MDVYFCTDATTHSFVKVARMKTRNDWNHKTMPAIAPLTAVHSPQVGPMLRVYKGVDCDEDSVTIRQRISNPLPDETRRKVPHREQKEFWKTSPIDPAVVAAATEISKQFSSPTLSDDDRSWLRSNLSLRELYQDFMLPDRSRKVDLGQLKRGTLAKDRQAINRWERFSVPGDWPQSKPWPGVPIGMITAPILSYALNRMKGELADGTVLTTKTHLATMLHYAERLRLIDPILLEPVDVERTDARFFSDAEVVAAFRSLSRRPELQVMFVLSLATGARPLDLFCLRVRDLRLDRNPVVRFNAEKTGVHLALPLAPVVVSHLRRLPLDGEYLFPKLGSPTAVNPEASPVSRRRRSDFKTLLFSAGVCDLVDGKEVEVNCPHQACRSTASLWIEKVARGMSSTLLGHCDDSGAARRVTRTHYLPTEMEPSPELTAAVNAVKWPEVFNVF